MLDNYFPEEDENETIVSSAFYYLIKSLSCIEYFDFVNFYFKFKNNLDLNNFLKMDEEEFFINFLSLIISIKTNSNVMIKLFEAFMEKNNIFDSPLLDWIRLLYCNQYTNFYFNFLPNTTIPDMFKEKDEDAIKYFIKDIKEILKNFLMTLNNELFKDVLKHITLEKFLITILYVEDKSGFVLDINTNGLTNSINEFLFK